MGLGALSLGLRALSLGLRASSLDLAAAALAICISIFFFNKASISMLRSKANGSSSFAACAKPSFFSCFGFLNIVQSIIIKPIVIIAKTKIKSLLLICIDGIIFKIV